MTDLKNPYVDDPTFRTSVRTEHTVHSIRPGIEDYNYIKSMHQRGNTLQLTFYHLLTKFIYELKRKHGTPAQYDPDAFEQALRGCTITLPGGNGSADANADRENPRRDVGRGAGAMAQSHPGHQPEPSNVPSGSQDKGVQKRVKKTNKST